MKYWLSIKDKLNDHIGLATQLLLLVLGIYVLIMAEKHILLKAPLLFIGLLSWFLWRDKTRHPIIWIVLAMLLIFDLINSYFWVANHHFMLLFMVLSVIMHIYIKRNDILLKNIQMLLVVVIFTSAFQKLTSNEFMNGDFYYYMINRGFVFRFFIKFFPESLELVKSNSESLLALHATDPNLAEHVVLKDIVPNLRMISVIFAWFTVVIESLVAIAMLWKPRSTWTHLFYAAMILGILCARFETGFMSLLAICGLLLCNNLKLRLLYIVIGMACITFIVTKIGFH